MLDDFQFDDFDDDEEEEGDGSFLPEDSGDDGGANGSGGGLGDNRTFLYVAGGLGAITVIGIILLAVYAFVVKPGQTTAVDESGNQTAVAQNATTNAQNTVVAAGVTEAALALSATATFTNTAPAPTDTPIPAATNTPLAGAVTQTPGGSTNTPGGPTATGDGKGGGGFAPTSDPRTATVESLLTQASVAQTQAAGTVEALPTSTPVTALPDTGFFDDFGAAGLTAFAALLIVVIFAARRLRDANA